MSEFQLGDAPIEPQYEQDMRVLAGFLDEQFNGHVKGQYRETGFVLLVFPFGEREGRCNYISNGAGRKEIVKFFREQIKRFEGEPERSRAEPGTNDRTLIERLELAGIAACTCLTKTPEWEHHEANCRYRLLQECANELREQEHSFELRWNADIRAIKRWQAATGRELTWPDHADLVVWLLERLDAAEGRT